MSRRALPDFPGRLDSAGLPWYFRGARSRQSAELLASAGGFGATRGRKRFAGGNLGEVVGSFFAFRRDGQVHVYAFAAIAREGRSSEDLIVGMREDREEHAGVGSGSLLRKENGSE